jgi:hypothetical protein
MPRPSSLLGVQISFQAFRHRALLVFSSLTAVHQKMAASFDMNLLEKKDVRHIVDRNGSKVRLYELKSGCVREFICLVCAEFRFEFIEHEVVGRGSVFGWKN